MHRDFTIETYAKLLGAAREAGYHLTSYECYVKGEQEHARVVILRHDVDKRPERALPMAHVEVEMGATATYYFRAVPVSYDVEVIKDLVSMGHELGYHYEDLTLARGDRIRATDLFTRHLNEFRTYYSVCTICMHGSPLSRWDNRCLFEELDYRTYGVIAEPYFDLDFDQVFYLTDTGRRWDGAAVGIRDKVDSCFNLRLRATHDIITGFQNDTLPDQLMINTHPQRWSETLPAWIGEYVSQNTKNLFKRVLVQLGHGQ